MQSTIPGIEFVKGIPWNLDEDSFLDSEVRNLIVVDDLMTQGTKDSNKPVGTGRSPVMSCCIIYIKISCRKPFEIFHQPIHFVTEI